MGEASRNKLPGSVLFACTLNAVRSPMAEALTKHLYGTRAFVDSAGVRAGELDPFAVAVMAEIGVDLSGHTPKSFDDLEDTSFDLVIALTQAAQEKAREFARNQAVQIDYWETADPTEATGSREQRLEAYRALRDDLMRRIEAFFGPATAANSPL